MTDIRIDEPGAGTWIMGRLDALFNPLQEHSFASYDNNGEIMGGFVTAHFFGASVTVHMAAQDKRWCSRDLLWLVFHYAFNQLGCYKMLAPLASDMHDVIEMDMRAGWVLETVIKDVYAPGKHMLVLSMTKDQCPWLNHTPRFWTPGSHKVVMNGQA